MLHPILKISPELSKEGVNLFLLPMVIILSTNYLMITDEHKFHEIRISNIVK